MITEDDKKLAINYVLELIGKRKSIFLSNMWKYFSNEFTDAKFWELKTLLEELEDLRLIEISHITDFKDLWYIRLHRPEGM